MAFNDNSINFGNPEDILRCSYGGDNNLKKNGGCGKHVERLIRRVKFKDTGKVYQWFYPLLYCKDHRYLDDTYEKKYENQFIFEEK